MCLCGQCATCKNRAYERVRRAKSPSRSKVLANAITDEMKEKWQKLYKAGYSPLLISKRFDVPVQRVRRYLLERNS